MKSTNGQSPFQLHFGHGLIFVQINLQHSQAQPYSICTCDIFSASHWGAVSSIFNSLVWQSPSEVEPNSSQSLSQYSYTPSLYIESVNKLSLDFVVDFVLIEPSILFFGCNKLASLAELAL